MDDPRNTCACGHRRRDHWIAGAPGAPLEDTRWFECEVCDCEQFDGDDPPSTAEEEADFRAGLAEIEQAEREAMKDVNLRLNDSSEPWIAGSEWGRDTFRRTVLNDGDVS